MSAQRCSIRLAMSPTSWRPLAIECHRSQSDQQGKNALQLSSKVRIEMVEPPTQRRKRSRSLTVTRKGQVTLRKDLLAHLGIQPGQRIDVEVLPGGRLELHAEQATGSINSFIGLLAGRSSHCASLEELNQAAAAGWAGLGDANAQPSTSP